MHLLGNALICASTVLECSCCRIHRYVAAPHNHGHGRGLAHGSWRQSRLWLRIMFLVMVMVLARLWLRIMFLVMVVVVVKVKVKNHVLGHGRGCSQGYGLESCSWSWSLLYSRLFG